MRLHVRSSLIAVALFGGATACSLLYPLDDFVTARAEAEAGPPMGDDSGRPRDGSIDAQLDADDADDADIPMDGATDSGCKGARGPTPIDVGGFCIDETVVTAADYQVFYDDMLGGGTPPVQPAECAFNVSNPAFGAFKPATGWPPAVPALPVRYVDWCDAYAYCAWAGKRLCGAVVDGGTVAISELVDSTKSEYKRACTSGGANVYPYAGSFAAGRCNLGGAVAPPKNFAGCKTPAGVYDLLGTVEGWVNACSGTVGADDTCAAQAGAFNDTDDDTVTCTAYFTPARNSARDDIGIRCCSEHR